jgi:hypothetical protein
VSCPGDVDGLEERVTILTPGGVAVEVAGKFERYRGDGTINAGPRTEAARSWITDRLEDSITILAREDSCQLLARPIKIIAVATAIDRMQGMPYGMIGNKNIASFRKYPLILQNLSGSPATNVLNVFRDTKSIVDAGPEISDRR